MTGAGSENNGHPLSELEVSKLLSQADVLLGQARIHSGGQRNQEVITAVSLLNQIVGMESVLAPSDANGSSDG